ncbi:RNA-binding protein 10-like isoform X3 [Arapaima gigas]
MWDGPRPGPRGGPLLRGQMFEGRECPVPEFRGRDPMHMSHRPPERPPMDIRRFERPPDMRPRDMEPLDIRGRDPNRVTQNFFRPGDGGDMGMRRRYEMDMRNNLQAPPGFMNPVRHPLDMGRQETMKPRGMREVDGSFIDMRERERYRGNMPGFNEPPMDSRRRHPMDNVGRGESFRDFSDRSRMGMKDVDGFGMDIQPRDREMMEFDRKNTPSLNTRTRFESDVDFRNRVRPSEFRDKERSPLRFGENDGVPMDVRGRPDLPQDFSGLNRSKFRGGEGNFREQNFPEQREPLMGFRGREDKPHSEDWQGRDMGGRGPFLPHLKGGPPFQKGRERFNLPRARESGPGEPDFQGRERPPMDFPLDGQKGYGFHPPGRDPLEAQNWEKNAPPNNHLSGQDSSAFGHKGSLESTRPPVDPTPLNLPNRENKCWPRDQNAKQDQTVPMSGRPSFLRGMNPSQGMNLDHCGLDSCPTFDESNDLPSDQGPGGVNLTGGQEDFLDNSSRDCRDQDYRDIDYRTGAGHSYEYEPGDPHITETAAKDCKPASPQRFDDTVTQMKDQDYRAGTSIKEKVSNTISITGIPKTATMEQILGAFAVRDGVPMQGMKIKNVVPGYSYDTAYVEFLNIEDAVHFMESNQGALKVGTKTALMRYIQPDGESKDPLQSTRNKDAQPLENPLSSPAVVKMEPPETASPESHSLKQMPSELPQAQWQRSSNLTPEAWQQQVDQQLQQQQAESLAARTPRLPPQPADPVFKESKTMIIKNVKPNTMVETILKALEPYAYLDERNVRLIRGKPPGAKCFCFVDMDSHEQVTRLVDVLTKPPPLMIDGVRVYVEVAKPLKNQNYRRDYDKSNTSLLGYPPDMEQQYYAQPVQAPLGTPALLQGDPMLSSNRDPAMTSDPNLNSNLAQGMTYANPTVAEGTFQASEPQVSSATAVLAATGDEAYSYTAETPDMSTYLYDATSGFYYDPQTTLYYDPSSRYFYNAQTQQYLYWDTVTKSYVPVAGYTTDTQPPVAQAAAVVTLASGPVAAVAEAQAADPTHEGKKTIDGTSEKKEEEDPSPRPEKKEKEKEEKPRSLAAFKIMKDMERWAKIQNRQKESVRVPSPVLKTPSSMEEKKASKAADAAFAIFERKGTVGDDLFKKPLAPPKKEEKSLKRPMGSLGLLAADYGAGSDEEEEEKHEAPRPVVTSQAEEKEDRLTDWKKMACLLCRRQFPNKDALVRHQQLSDLHKQNMEIHLKIKRSKKELEALENQEKQLSTRERERERELTGSPEMKRKKYQNSWSSGSREMHVVGERPGLGAEPMERKKKEPVVWNHATYKQAVRKAMFARFKELE